MIITVVTELHWKPEYIETLYVDEIDVYGLELWYFHFKELSDRIKGDTKK